MKTKAFFILLLTCTISFGQSNNSLVETNKLWSNLKRADAGSPPPYFQISTFIKFNGDTIVASNQYKKVYESYDSQHQYWSLIGFIREDLSKKVYYLPIQNSVERLLYNFDVAIGDTIHVWTWGTNQRDLVVTNIDYVYVYNKNLKRLTLSNFGEQWIEGIGSLEGLLACGTHDLTGMMYDLLCFYENDTLKYSNPNFTNCYINNTGVDIFKSHIINVNIFPNPVTSTSVLSITGKQDNDYVLEIYSLLGEKIKTISNIKNKQVLINKSDFKNGIYLYRLINTGKDIVTGKFSVI